MSENGGDIEDAFALARAGRTIDAIAAYRRATGVSLAEAAATIRAGVPVAPAPVSPEMPPQDAVDAALRDGHKIAAIQAYRKATGVSLHDAKTTVDARYDELVRLGEIIPPESLTAGTGGSPLPAVLVALLVVCVVVFFLVTHH